MIKLLELASKANLLSQLIQQPFIHIDNFCSNDKFPIYCNQFLKRTLNRFNSKILLKFKEKKK